MAPHLLAIDDEQDLLFTCQLIPEPEGYDISLAFSGWPGAHSLERVLPDLLMPGYHGGKHSGKEPLFQQPEICLSASALPLISCIGNARVLYAYEDLLREGGVRVILKLCAIDALLQTTQQLLQETSALKTL